MALLVSLSTWALTEYLLGSRSRRWAAVYVLAAAGLLWSHYLGLTVLALHNLAMLVWLVRAHRAGSAEARPALRDWALMQGAVLLAFLPWLPVMLSAAGGWPPITSRQPLWFYFAETARLYTYGPAIERLSALAWVGFVPAVLGLALAPRRVRSGLLWGLVAVAVRLARLLTLGAVAV